MATIGQGCYLIESVEKKHSSAQWSSWKNLNKVLCLHRKKPLEARLTQSVHRQEVETNPLDDISVNTRGVPGKEPGTSFGKVKGSKCCELFWDCEQEVGAMLIGKACTISRTHLAQSPRNWCPQLTSKYLQTLNCHNSYEGRITAINYLNWQSMSNRYCLEHIKPALVCVDRTMGDRDSFGDRRNLATIPFKWVIKLVLSHARRLGGNASIDSCSRRIPNCLHFIEEMERIRFLDFTLN